MATSQPEVLAASVPLAPSNASRSTRMAGRLGRSLGIVLPATLLAIIFLACFVWPLVGSLPAPIGGNILNADLGIGAHGHVLGTDPVGNDELSRLLYGGRASLEVALAVNGIGILLGGLVGAGAAYIGGVEDAVIMRVLDVMIAFPSLVLAMVLADGLGASEIHTIWALCFFSVPAFARVARAAALRVQEQPFILAAQMSGTRRWRALLTHIAPNILPQLITFALLGMGVTVMLEGGLSFLGLGIPLPAPSWGNMIAQGQQLLSTEPRYVLLPSAALCITVIAFNLLGEALRSRWGS